MAEEKRDPVLVEWSAWQRIVRTWHMNTGDINHDDDLVNAIKNWGEELVALRLGQDAFVRARARDINCRSEKQNA